MFMEIKKASNSQGTFEEELTGTTGLLACLCNLAEAGRPLLTTMLMVMVTLPRCMAPFTRLKMAKPDHSIKVPTEMINEYIHISR